MFKTNTPSTNSMTPHLKQKKTLKPQKPLEQVYEKKQPFEKHSKCNETVNEKGNKAMIVAIALRNPMNHAENMVNAGQNVSIYVSKFIPTAQHINYYEQKKAQNAKLFCHLFGDFVRYCRISVVFISVWKNMRWPHAVGLLALCAFHQIKRFYIYSLKTTRGLTVPLRHERCLNKTSKLVKSI